MKGLVALMIFVGVVYSVHILKENSRKLDEVIENQGQIEADLIRLMNME